MDSKCFCYYERKLLPNYLIGTHAFPSLETSCFQSNRSPVPLNSLILKITMLSARGCQDFSYSLKIRLMHFYINTLPLGVSFPIAIELMLITPIFFELCPILCFDLGVFNNFGVFINTKESNKVNLL